MIAYGSLRGCIFGGQPSWSANQLLGIVREKPSNRLHREELAYDTPDVAWSETDLFVAKLIPVLLY